MMRHALFSEDQSSYEYHGSTTIEITRKRDGVAVETEWMLFDTVEEAQDFLNDNTY